MLLRQSEAEDTLYEAHSDLGNKLTDVVDQVTSLIAETNACGFSTDDVEILEVGHFIFSEAGIPFRARLQLTGEQEDEKVFHGNKIIVDVTGSSPAQPGQLRVERARSLTHDEALHAAPRFERRGRGQRA